MALKSIALVALGGAIGAVLRYLVGLWLSGDGFPWSTLSVNLVGSLLFGALAWIGVDQELFSESIVVFVGIGILGSFTTLSTYSVDSLRLWQEESWGSLCFYVGTTAIIGPLMALLGWKGASLIVNNHP